MITKTPGQYGDQQNAHFLIDCSDLSFMQTLEQNFGPEGPMPPSIRRYAPSPPPATGTLLRKAFEVACGSAPVESQIIADPYSWMKAQWRQKAGK